MIKLVAAKVRFLCALSHARSSFRFISLPLFSNLILARFSRARFLSLSLLLTRCNNDSLSFIVIINIRAEKASGRGGEARRGGRVEREGRPAEKRRGDSVSQR